MTTLELIALIKEHIPTGKHLSEPTGMHMIEVELDDGYQATLIIEPVENEL